MTDVLMSVTRFPHFDIKDFDVVFNSWIEGGVCNAEAAASAAIHLLMQKKRQCGNYVINANVVHRLMMQLLLEVF